MCRCKVLDNSYCALHGSPFSSAKIHGESWPPCRLFDPIGASDKPYFVAQLFIGKSHCDILLRRMFLVKQFLTCTNYLKDSWYL